MEPFLRHNPVAPYTPDTVPAPDLILVSHAAWDHMGDAAEIARRTGAPVVCPADVAEKMYDEGRARGPGPGLDLGRVLRLRRHRGASRRVPPLERRDPRGWPPVAGVPLSFIVETEPGVRIYHFGDTTIFPGLQLIGELYRPTVGLLGIAQTEGCPIPARVSC